MAMASSKDLDASPPPPPNDQENTTNSLPFASFSLTLSLLTPTPAAAATLPKSLSSAPTTIKIPSQLSTFHTLHPTPSPNPKSISISSSSLLSPFPISTHRNLPSEPSGSPFPLSRRRVLLWFRSDLRLHDNEALSAAASAASSILPVFVFDPRDFGKSPYGFDRTGPYRANFLLNSVADLRNNLRARGADLIIRIGRPEETLLELVRAAGANALYAHSEVSRDECQVEEKVSKAMEKEGVEVKYFWGSTLYHLEDLPFGLEEMPVNYGGFKEKLKGVQLRKVFEAPDEIKGVPLRNGLEPGEVPTLQQLGLSAPPAIPQDGKPAIGSTLVGGETEALERLQKFAAECCAQPKKGDNESSIYGANFSCKISPWLATGCLSPRFMYEELKKHASRLLSSAKAPKNDNAGSDPGMNWLMFELMWRDFFRFITKKYSSVKKNGEVVVPATGCTPAFA